MLTNRSRSVSLGLRWAAAALALGLGLGAGSCDGNTLAPPEPIAATQLPLRRLNRTEYLNTLRDLVPGLPAAAYPAASSLPADQKGNGFDTDGALLTVSSALAVRYIEVAEVVAEAASAEAVLTKLLPAGCSRAMDERGCAVRFIEAFGRRAFRRPLRPEESAAALALYDRGRTGGTFNTGAQWVLQYFLQAPAFLYRVELGKPQPPTEAGADGTSPAASEPGALVHTPLTAFEVATRLSYALWKTMPDDALLAKAEADALGTPEQVRAEAERMLDDPRARAMLYDFHAQWLDLDLLPDTTKNPYDYPTFPTLRSVLPQETSLFIENVIYKDKGDLATLLTAPYSFVNDVSAPVYGLSGITGSTLRKVDLNPQERAGLLTQLGVLSVHAKPAMISPVVRGHFVQERLLCGTVPSQPPGLAVTLPESAPPGTDVFAVQLTQAACASCHRMMNPIGNGFARYNPIGQYAAQSGGQPISARGELVGSDSDGAFDGVPELARRLAQSAQVGRCYQAQWFHYVFGRSVMTEDAALLAALGASFQSSGGRIRDLILAAVSSETFLSR